MASIMLHHLQLFLFTPLQLLGSLIRLLSLRSFLLFALNRSDVRWNPWTALRWETSHPALDVFPLHWWCGGMSAPHWLWRCCVPAFQTWTGWNTVSVAIDGTFKKSGFVHWVPLSCKSDSSVHQSMDCSVYSSPFKVPTQGARYLNRGIRKNRQTTFVNNTKMEIQK